MEIKPTKKEQVFIDAYLACIDFTEERIPVTDLTAPSQPAEWDIESGLDEDFLRESYIDCLAFFSRICCYLSDDQFDQAGHDFWLTRNRHGTGFWDREKEYGETHAERFTKIAESFGEVDATYNELKTYT